MTRVLVTGSSGFVGGAIARHLLESGCEVVGLGRGLTAGNRALTGAVAADIGKPGLADALRAGQPRCDAIVHAAAAVTFAPFAPEIATTNCLGTQQLLELAMAWEVGSFVFLSSLPVIGRPVRTPITEEHPTAPLTAYHASKLYGERLVSLCTEAGLSGISMRLTAPVGAGMPGSRVLAAFAERARAGEPLEVAGRGSRGQDYVDVLDIATAVAAAIERPQRGVVNLGSGRCVTNLELAQACVAQLGSSSAIETVGEDSEEGVRWEVSIAAAGRLLSYRPQRSLADSIEAVADDLRTVARA